MPDLSGRRAGDGGDLTPQLAFPAARGAAIELVFTDVVMPGALSSRDLARPVQQRLPGLPVLFTSGDTDNAIVHGGKLDPDVDLLSKPYTREDLARKLRQVLAKPAPAPAAEQLVTGLGEGAYYN